jgi:hypothetical protein
LDEQQIATLAVHPVGMRRINDKLLYLKNDCACGLSGPTMIISSAFITLPPGSSITVPSEVVTLPLPPFGRVIVLLFRSIFAPDRKPVKKN